MEVEFLTDPRALVRVFRDRTHLKLQSYNTETEEVDVMEGKKSIME